MYKILVFGMTENPGGVESFLINYYRHIDRNKIRFDFLCNSYNKIAYEDELRKLGGNIFHISARSKHFFQYRKELRKLFVKYAKEYNAIWVNVSSLANIDYLKMAKKYGINRRIIHSHNSKNMDKKIRGLLHNCNKKCIGKYATDFLACSEEAAKWFYIDEIFKKAIVIHNAIDVKKLKYDEKKRNKIRTELHCQNKFVIGNVGRLHFQKNQIFVLEVFNELIKRLPNAELILVGQGNDLSMLRKKAVSLGISDNVKFVGVQRDIGAWLSAFDFFLFPSLFEGLGIAALEAQANGMPVLASGKVIPQEIKINGNFEFYDLNFTAFEWASKILEMRNHYNRISEKIINENFRNNGYDISCEVGKLESFFLRDS